MEPVTHIDQEMASDTFLPIRLLLGILKIALQILFLPFEEEKTDSGQEMALHDAVMSGNLTSVEYLLTAGRNPSERDKEHYTPLHWAAAKGYTQIARKLFEYGAGLEERGGRFRFTPLHMAAGEGQLNTSRLLLDAGAQVNSLDRFHDTPIHWAAWFGHLSLVQMLVDRGGNFTAKNRDGSTPRDMAYVRSNEAVVRFLDGI